jgi:hypothetical protein
MGGLGVLRTPTTPIYPIARVIPEKPSFHQTFAGIFRIIMQARWESP